MKRPTILGLARAFRENEAGRRTRPDAIRSGIEAQPGSCPIDGRKANRCAMSEYKCYCDDKQNAGSIHQNLDDIIVRSMLIWALQDLREHDLRFPMSLIECSVSGRSVS
jgi:hypothetical protein